MTSPVWLSERESTKRLSHIDLPCIYLQSHSVLNFSGSIVPRQRRGHTKAADETLEAVTERDN